MRLPQFVVPSQTQPPVLAAASAVQSALLAVVLTGALSTTIVQPALALGPKDTQIGLVVKAYEEVDCPPELAQGRAGGALGAGAGGAGIAQKCVGVTADVTNESGKEVSDAAVFGVITEKKTGMSVMGNGQDGKNDAGQLAMIPKVTTGKSTANFIIVAQQADSCIPTRKEKCPVQGTAPLVELSFEKMKAIAYPGGDRFKFYDECEQNEFAEGC